MKGGTRKLLKKVFLNVWRCSDAFFNVCSDQKLLLMHLRKLPSHKVTKKVSGVAWHGSDAFRQRLLNYKDTKPKKIYRLKEDQAFSLSLELGRRSKFARHPSADFLQSPSNLSPISLQQTMTLLHSFGGGGQDFVDTIIAVKMLLKGQSQEIVFLVFFIQFYEVISVHSYVR